MEINIKKSLNGNVIENYNEIKEMSNGDFRHFPGVYCKNCGETFALYSYSLIQPDGIDDNLKPFYNDCFRCNKK